MIILRVEYDYIKSIDYISLEFEVSIEGFSVVALI